MGRLVHFELNADNPKIAAAFYAKVFDWRVQKWKGTEGSWLRTTGYDNDPGINVALMRRTDPGATTANTIGLDSIDQGLERIVEKGGKVIMARTNIFGVGWLDYCRDTECHTFKLIENIIEEN